MEKQRHYPSSQSYAYSVVMYGCECWTIQKAQCWRTDAFELVLEKTLESSLNCKEIKPVNPKRNQSWIFIHWKDWCWSWNSNTLAIDAKNWLIRKDSDAGKDWSQEEKGTTEGEMVGWHHWIDGHKLIKLRELEMDREACCAAVREVAKSRTQWATELKYLCIYIFWINL